jgi:DNA mismatch repair protein MutS
LNAHAPIETTSIQPAATPMMEQYHAIKAANPDSLLFYRMGDFYELFFDDAVIAAGVLGIALTKRGKHLGQDIPMCGVPIHASDDYLSKLIGRGHRVAVCDQIEDPADAKKRGSKSVVARDVVRLVTPGTITEEKLLAPGEASYLMALGRTKGAEAPFALAWIDISTGAFTVMDTSADRLLADILRIEPRELIVPEPVFYDPELKPVFDVLGRIANPQPASQFDTAAAEGRITRYYDVATLDGFGSFSRPALSAIAGAIAYVEKTQKAERPPLARPVREDGGAAVFIDPATRGSLELTRTQSGSRDGSLISAIDRTVTGAGARLLAERLTAPLTDAGAINARLDSVSLFCAEGRLAESLRLALRDVPDLMRALTRLALHRGGPRDLGAIGNGLKAAQAIADLMGTATLPAELSAAVLALHELPSAVSDSLSAALDDSLPLLKRDGGFVAKGHHAELDEMRSLATESRQVIAAMERDLCEETGIRSLKIRHNNVLGYYIEVTAGSQGALHSPPDHGQRHALHHNRTRRARDQDRQCRRPCSDDRAGPVRRAGCPCGGTRRSHPAGGGRAGGAGCFGCIGGPCGVRKLQPPACR